jgi:TRAP-type C4-dicarboxylate transport system permease small subunit
LGKKPSQHSKGGAVASYHGALRRLIVGLAITSGVAVLCMMGLTAMDVLLRTAVNSPIPGAYDVVKVLGSIAIAAALPYTTAIKGHVAVEFFFQKMKRRGRLIVDTANRLLVITLFAALTVKVIKYGISLQSSGEVTPTLEMPIYPVVYFMALCCAVSTLAVLHNLLHPGKEMIKP